MNIFDSSYLSIFLNANPPVPHDRSGKSVRFFKERIEALVARLNASDEIIGVPAPALAEILVRAGAQRTLFVNILNDRYKFEIIPFGARAAIEAAELIDKIKEDTRGKRVETWAKVKFDTQIIAIAKAESATTIYSDDVGIETSAKRVGIRVLRICDLPYLAPVVSTIPHRVETPIGSQLSLLPEPDEAPLEDTAEQDIAESVAEIAGSDAAVKLPLEAAVALAGTVPLMPDGSSPLNEAKHDLSHDVNTPEAKVRRHITLEDETPA